MLNLSIIPVGEVRPVARGLLRPPPGQLPPLQSVKLLDQVRERVGDRRKTMVTAPRPTPWRVDVSGVVPTHGRIMLRCNNGRTP